MAKGSQIHPLTSLRFAAAIIVVFHHTYQTFLPSTPLPRVMNGAIALAPGVMSFFFLLSGFILAYNYLGPLDGADPPFTKDRRSFWLARFARIYPVYMLAFLIQAPFICAHRLHADAAASTAVAKLLVSFGTNAALLQAWSRKLWGGWNGPAWSLSTETFFYALFPFLTPILWRSRRSDGALLVGLYAAAMVVPVAVLILYGERPPLEVTDIMRTFPPLRLPEMFAGVVLARAYRRGSSPLLAHPTALWVTGGAMLLAAAYWADRIPLPLLPSGLTPAFALVLMGMSTGDTPIHRLLSRKPLLVLGESTFAVYVLHIPLFAWFCYLVRPDARFWDEPRLFGVDKPYHLVAFVALTVGISLFTLTRIEEPARRWINRRGSRGGSGFLRWSAPAPAAAGSSDRSRTDLGRG